MVIESNIDTKTVYRLSEMGCAITGREPGRFDHLRKDVLGMVLCVVWVIELLPMHTALELC